MNTQQKLAIIAYLQTFMTENKRTHMQRVLPLRTRAVTLVAENMMHAHNASALLRTAECLGIQNVHVVQSDVRFRASESIVKGSVQWINLYRHRSTQESFAALRAQGYRIIAMTPHLNGCDLADLRVGGKMAFVFGTELDGLSEYAFNHADEYVKIPMVGFTESLNVSVCAGITLYSVVQQFYAQGTEWQLSEDERIDILLEWCRRAVRRSDLIEKRFVHEKHGSL